jgi:PAS domain-containing protein
MGVIRYEDLPLETKNGRRINVEFVSNVYPVDGTQVVQCNIRDITERARAEAALKISETHHRSVFEGAVHGIYRGTLDGRFLDVNPALVAMLGFSGRGSEIERSPGWRLGIRSPRPPPPVCYSSALQGGPFAGAKLPRQRN